MFIFLGVVDKAVILHAEYCLEHATARHANPAGGCAGRWSYCAVQVVGGGGAAGPVCIGGHAGEMTADDGRLLHGYDDSMASCVQRWACQCGREGLHDPGLLAALVKQCCARKGAGLLVLGHSDC